MTDYRTLLADTLLLDDEMTDVLLATKVSDLCPDCEGQPCPKCNGTGEVAEHHEPWSTEWIGCHYCHGEPCDHPNAPTIARLLAIGEAVWTARKEEQ